MAKNKSAATTSESKPKIIKEGYQPNDGAIPINPPKGGSAVRPKTQTQADSGKAK